MSGNYKSTTKITHFGCNDIYHMTSQQVHKSDEVRRFRTQRRDVQQTYLSPVLDLFYHLLLSVFLRKNRS